MIDLLDILDGRFLYEIQRAKMEELWDNKEDEVWENL